MEISVGEERVPVSLQFVPLDKLEPMLDQPRRFELSLRFGILADEKDDIQNSPRFKQLVNSIIENKGIISPLLVEESNDKYLVVDGDRRLGACRIILNDKNILTEHPKIKNFIQELPCLVLKHKLTEEQRLRLLAYTHVHHVSWGLAAKEKVVLDLSKTLSEEKVAAIMGVSKGNIMKSKQLEVLSKRIDRGKGGKSYAKELLSIRQSLLDDEIMEATIAKINSKKIKSPVELRKLREILSDDDAKKKYLEPESEINHAYAIILAKNVFPTAPNIKLEELIQQFITILNSIDWPQLVEYKNNEPFREMLDKCIQRLNSLKTFI